MKKSVQIISIRGEVMVKGKSEKKKKIKKKIRKKMEAIKYQKYYTAGAIILMFVVLISMYLLLY